MAKRKSSKKQSQGVIYLIVLACLALICREPIARALQDKLPVVKERITQKATPVITGSPLLPAPLKNVPEQILHRKGYTTSYNREHKIPNWVAWELTPEKLIERESRTDKFLPDPDLPESQAVTTDDYKRSGMDRGHMCPAGDNRWHWKAMQESFYMTNICPEPQSEPGRLERTGRCLPRMGQKGRKDIYCMRSSSLPAKTSRHRQKTQSYRARSLLQSHTLYQQ